MKSNVIRMSFILFCMFIEASINLVFAQWPNIPGGYNSNWYTDNYRIQINNISSIDNRCFEVQSLASVTASPMPIFRVTTLGQMTFGPVHGDFAASLNFTQLGEKFGSINTASQSFNIEAERQLRFRVRSGHEVAVFDNDISFYKPLSLYLTPDIPGGIIIKSGKNGDPTLASTYDRLFRISAKGGVAIWDNDQGENDNSPLMVVRGGSVGIGIGVEKAEATLHVKGSYIVNQSGDIKSAFGVSTETDKSWMGTYTNNGLFLGANLKKTIYCAPTNHCYIGFDSFADIPTVRTEILNKYSMFIKKGILSEDFSIAPKTTWADFVLSPDYQLKPLEQIETFIKENEHLPDVPSASEVAEKGYSQHEMNKALLQKIEELTLYVIQQQKEIEVLKSQIK